MRHRPAIIVGLGVVWNVACGGETKPLPTTLASGEDEAVDSDAPPTDSDDTAPPVDSADTGSDLPPWDEGPPPVVVLFIGDGMGADHVRGAGLFQSGVAGSLFVETAPHTGWLQTASMSGYTDSAASATTMATGTKTANGRIGQDVHGHEVEGLVDLARLRGLSVGVVTTDTLTGATPASFFTHAESRYDTAVIASGFAAAPPEVMLGGGAGDLLSVLTEAGVPVLQTAEELADATVDLSRPLVGIVADRELPFLVDMPADDPTPRLPALVSTALDHLLTDPDGLLLIVEGARIDHASHLNRSDAVFQEVLEFDQAIADTVARLEGLDDRAVTVLVTADHECGGLTILDDRIEPETGRPPMSWLWNDHTNRDVPVYGWGEATRWIDGDRRHNGWVWSVLDGALRSRDPTAPTLPRLADGDLDDLGPPLVVQTADTDFGAGFNQLDGLRVAVDENGLWVGVDGVFDERANGVVVWLDLDPGAGTGVGADLDLIDVVGLLDRFFSAPTVVSAVDGVGFDAAVGQIGASYARTTSLRDMAGVRRFQPPTGTADDLSWHYSAVNYDDGNIADGAPAVDAGGTGASVGGMEIFVAHDQLFEGGLPAAGASIALAVTLASSDGTTWSNQALPPQDVRGGDGSVQVSSVVTLSFDGTGTLTDGPTIVVAP